MKLKFTIFLIAIVLTNYINAQEPIRSVYTPFFKELTDNEPHLALTEILKRVTPENATVVAAKITSEFAKLDTSDRLVRYDQVKVRNMGWYISVQSYMLLYEKQPFLLSIVFYKKNRVWFVQDFYIRSNFSEALISSEQQLLLSPSLPAEPPPVTGN